MQPLSDRQLNVAGHQITLQLPADPDQLLDDATRSDRIADPYWGILWDAALETAACVLKSQWPPNQRALELGCGAGLVGIAGLMAGLNVTFSDMVSEAVELALLNAGVNGFPDAVGTELDWREPCHETFDVLLASDILYDTQSHRALLTLARNILVPGGSLRIGDPGRQQAELFLKLAAGQGWAIALYDRELQPIEQTAVADFQWIVLS